MRIRYEANAQWTTMHAAQLAHNHWVRNSLLAQEVLTGYRAVAALQRSSVRTVD